MTPTIRKTQGCCCTRGVGRNKFGIETVYRSISAHPAVLKIDGQGSSHAEEDMVMRDIEPPPHTPWMTVWIIP